MTTATLAMASGLAITDLIPEWTRHLRAAGRSKDTVELYTLELVKLHRWLARQGMPVDVGLVKREHIEAWLVDMQDRGLAEATVSLSFRSVRPFFVWLVDTDEVKVNPMVRMKPPTVHIEAKSFPAQEVVERLLGTCRTKSFVDLRDAAIIHLLYDSGIRRGELVGLQLRDVDTTPAYETPSGAMVYPTLSVFGKARRHRKVVLNEAARMAMKRYVIVRAHHPDADHPALWLGHRGPLLGGGVLQMVRRRGDLIGYDKLGVHAFRHAFAHNAMDAGMPEQTILTIAGWSDASMLRVYGRGAQEQRALDAHAKFSAGNRLRPR